MTDNFQTFSGQCHHVSTGLVMYALMCYDDRWLNALKTKWSHYPRAQKMVLLYVQYLQIERAGAHLDDIRCAFITATDVPENEVT